MINKSEEKRERETKNEKKKKLEDFKAHFQTPPSVNI